MLIDLWIMGEVSNLRVSPAGHTYFTLKDNQSALNCVMFRGQPGAELLANGSAVSAHGRISFYEPRGSTDFMVDLTMPEGVGDLALELERLKVRLEDDGLFDATRKRPLPQFPKVIGVVTSPTGAAFQDIQNVIRRRYPLVELVLSPTLVQGSDAALGIVAAIDRLNRDGRADLLIVTRGGGSLEDLWPFNEESVARAIYASRVPVISGVGHETDITIADLVADMRAPTPSAAAELVVPDRHEIMRQIAGLAEGSHRSIIYRLDWHRGKTAELVLRLEEGLPNIEIWRRRTDDLARSIHRSLTTHLNISQFKIAGFEHQLRALNPVTTLMRGFAVIQKARVNKPVTSTTQIAAGDAITITVADGVFPATAGPRTGNQTVRKKQKRDKNTNSTERLF
jgi:exodeoxyribonuclease VII large subunit